jgi:hypothetical protein
MGTPILEKPMSKNSKSELTRRRILQGTAAVAVSAMLPRSAFAQGPYSQPIPTGTPCPQSSTVTVTSATTATIPAQFVGLSYEKGEINYPQHPLFVSTNTSLLNLFSLLSGASGSVLRLGGASADGSTYNGWPGTGPSQVEDLAEFLAAIPNTNKSWQAIYGINLEGQDLTSSQQGYTTTALASEETSDVLYYFRQSGLSQPLIEMGNEPDNWGGTEMGGTYGGATYNLSAYEAIWKRFQQYVAGNNAGVKIAATAGGAYADGYASVPKSWETPFINDMVANGTPPALLTHHFYISSGTSSPAPTYANLRDWNLPNLVNNAPPAAPASNVTNFDQYTGTYLKQISSSSKIPYRLAECNSYWSGGAPGVSDAFVSALWVIDYLFRAAYWGASGVNFHTGYEAPYSSFFWVNGVVTVVNPIFHGMKFFNMALNQTTGTGTVLTTTTNNFYGENVSAYTVSTSAHTATVLLINKSSVYYFHPTITLPNKCISATLVALTTVGSTGLQSMNWNGSDYTTYDKNTQIQGAAIGADGSYTPDPTQLYTITPNANGSITCYLPTISAVLITVNF